MNTNILRLILIGLLLIIRMITWIFRRIIRVLKKIWCKIRKSLLQRARSRRLRREFETAKAGFQPETSEILCRSVHDKCCVEVPRENRAIPDPYIYSQDWLRLRGLAYSWDNPDFKLINVSNGQITNNRNLAPNTTYRIEATIHNHSTMAALDTRVDFEARTFGISAGIISGPGFDVVDVPAAGSVVAQVEWTTPNSIGHVCLIATISHPDDANPLNNKGQHNTDIVGQADPDSQEDVAARQFEVQNEGKGEQEYNFSMDGYELPTDPMRAKSFKEMRTKSYLQRLKNANNPKEFPLPAELKARIIDSNNNDVTMSTFSLQGGEKQTFTFEFDRANAKDGQRVNIHALGNNDRLIGGVTYLIKI